MTNELDTRLTTALEELLTILPIPLNAEQESAIKQWAADGRLWTTQATIEFNLHTLARLILKFQKPSVAIAIVKSFKGKAQRERRARGQSLGNMDKDFQIEVQAEERGGDIVIDEILNALAKL